VLVVVGVARDHRQADLLLELLDPLARGCEHLAQLLVVGAVGEQLLGARGVVLGVAPLRRELRGRLELAVGATDLGVALAVADHAGSDICPESSAKRVLDLLDERCRSRDDLEPDQVRSRGARRAASTSSTPAAPRSRRRAASSRARASSALQLQARIHDARTQRGAVAPAT
jgi:hypothetical protein